uniref:Hyaluronidase n=1 Tax=Panagrellus redivivus TaxID=6233 RepID=A0A7E4V5K7_PANRE
MILQRLLFLLVLNGVNGMDPFSIGYGITRFKVYWNIPSEVCNKKVQLDPEEYDIITNVNQSFIGDKIITLYENMLGLYPAIEATYDSTNPLKYNNIAIRNGGLPQRNNLTEHLAKVRSDIEKLVPNPDFDGPLVIDYEAWRPVWGLNWGNRRIYQEESIKYVQERFPGVSRRLAKLIATDEFNAAARKFMTRTIRAVRKLRPHAYVGFYDYTMCNYDAGKNASVFPACSQPHNDANDQLYWLYSESNALFPSIYYYDAIKMDEQWRQRYTFARINEAVMVRDLLGWRIPIFPYSKIIYKLDGTSSLDNFYTKSDQCLSLSFAAGFDIQGLILWSTIHKIGDLCENMTHYLMNDFGPNVVRTVEKSAQCDIERCNAHGRCVRKFPKSGPEAGCDYHRWPLKHYSCSCDLGYGGDECQNVAAMPTPRYMASDIDYEGSLIDTLSITVEEELENEPID